MSVDAHAMGAIVSDPPGAAQATSVRVALASAGSRTSRWVSLHVHVQDAPAAGLAWIVPVKPGTFVDVASDAWLESLEDATAPRVVPPPGPTPACVAAAGVDVAGDPSHVATTAPDVIAAAPDAASLASTLAAWGLALPGDLAPAVAAAGANGDSFLVLRFASPAGDLDTQTLRLVDDAPPAVALALTQATSPVTVTAYALGAGPAVLGASEPLAVDTSSLEWRASGGSTYADASALLLSANPGAWLMDTAGHDPVFVGEPLPDGGDVPALSQSYFARASAYGDASEPSSTCVAAAASWAASTSPVAVACPPAAVGRVGSASGDVPCVETVGPGEIAPGAFRCGGTADDLALALSGLHPGGAWVSRARSVIEPGAFGRDTGVTTAGASGAVASGPVLECSTWASCPPAGGVAPGTPGGSPGTSSSTGGTDPGVSAAGTVAGAALDSSDGCGGDSSSSSDGCGGSTDSGGDSSSESSGSCSGDTSSSSSSSSSSDSCSGDSSSNSNCAVRGASPSGVRGRSPTSRAALLLVAIAFVLRRRARTRIA
jgi:hypothetical protein